MAPVIPASIKRILNFRAQMPQLFSYLSFPASSPGKRKGVLMAQEIPPNIKRILTFPAQMLQSFSYLSFPCANAAIVFLSVLSMHKCRNYLPTCPFPPLRQGRGKAAWWHRWFLPAWRVWRWTLQSRTPPSETTSPTNYKQDFCWNGIKLISVILKINKEED